MRLTRYLYEGDAIKKALKIEEPAIGEEYSKEEVKMRISDIKDAIKAQKKNGIESEADNSLLKDLKDKLDKWENVKDETKPIGPVVPAVDVLAAQAAATPAGEKGPVEEKPKEEDEEDKKKKEKKKEEKWSLIIT